MHEFDDALGTFLSRMKKDDLLIITADHGCDPTFPGTDHTREYIPLLIAGKHIRHGVNLGVRKQFSDIGATVFEYLTGETWREGVSFLKDIWED